MFDIQRAALLDAYHPSATFSFSINTVIPARAQAQGLHRSNEFPNQQKLNWNAWLEAGSRNLTRLRGDKAVKALHVGSEEAIRAMIGLPKTKHEISGSPERYCIDAWPIGQDGDTKLLISMHGQFNEGGLTNHHLVAAVCSRGADAYLICPLQILLKGYGHSIGRSFWPLQRMAHGK